MDYVGLVVLMSVRCSSMSDSLGMKTTLKYNMPITWRCTTRPFNCGIRCTYRGFQGHPNLSVIFCGGVDTLGLRTIISMRISPEEGSQKDIIPGFSHGTDTTAGTSQVYSMKSLRNGHPLVLMIGVSLLWWRRNLVYRQISLLYRSSWRVQLYQTGFLSSSVFMCISETCAHNELRCTPEPFRRQDPTLTIFTSSGMVNLWVSLRVEATLRWVGSVFKVKPLSCSFEQEETMLCTSCCRRWMNLSRRQHRHL